ncbi:MAG: hypothetical protein KF764_20255 [Labilithrix sp.]|nr:hypothetical protein [Labilithrix sp.]
MLRALRRFLLFTLVLVACGGDLPTAKPPPSFDRGPDLDAQRLSPEEEINALLKAPTAYNHTESFARIAVPPLPVLGAADKQWVGEAVAELVAGALAQHERVSLLERGELTRLVEELKRADGGDMKSPVKIGKLLGAQYMIVGKVIAESRNAFLVSLSPVRVEDGERISTFQVRLRESGWADALTPAVDRVAAQFLEGPKVPAKAKPLSQDALELVSRARELQYQGRLIEADALYGQALRTPSTAWRVEADYLHVKVELGLHDWAVARAQQLLATMPVTRETMCDRARILMESNRRDSTVATARDAVRVAAACEDPSVTAAALTYYAMSLEQVDYEAALVAYRRAVRLATSKESGWIRCIANEEIYRLTSDNGNWQGSKRAHYEQNSRECSQAGNLRVASIAMRNAALFGERASERQALYAKAADLAKTVGGLALHDAVTQGAEELRESGAISAADRQLLALLKARLESVIAIYEGLPGAAAGLDDDLLRRAGVPRPPKPAKSLPGETELIGKAATIQLARALTAWATRTRDESKGQATAYQAIADKLDPPASPLPPNATDDQRFEANLERAGLPLSTILKASVAPPRGAPMKLADAAGTLDDRFWSLRTKKAPESALREIVSAQRTVAEWLKRPSALRAAIRNEARLEADLGQADLSRSLMRSTLAYASDDPGWQKTVLDFDTELLKRSQPQVAYESALQRINWAKRISLKEYEQNTYYAAYLGWDTKQVSLEAALASLMTIATEQSEAKEWEIAAAALRHAGALQKTGLQAKGSAEAVSVARLRVQWLDRLEDPLRSTLARVDLANEMCDYATHIFRNGARRHLEDDASVQDVMKDLRERLDALRREGRVRDATRAVGKLQVDLPGVGALLADALDWAKTFKDSAEYAPLAASLHEASADLDEDLASKRTRYGMARDLYVQAGQGNKAVADQKMIIISSDSEELAWASYDTCRQLLRETNATWEDDCSAGLGGMIQDRKYRLQDKKRLQVALKDAASAIAYVDRMHEPAVRNDLRLAVASIATCAEDLDTFDRLFDEVRTYYTKTEPNPYQWVTAIERLARGIALVDPKRATRLAREFDDVNGASDYWKASQYHMFATWAARANDTDSEQLFVSKGRLYSNVHVMYLPSYDTYRLPILRAAGDYKGVERAYRAAAATVAKTNPTYQVRKFELLMGAGVAQVSAKNLQGARATFEGIAANLDRQGDPEAPCFQSLIHELAAAASNASHACGGAAMHLKKASALRAVCATKAIPIPNSTGAVWTDSLGFTTFRAGPCGALPSVDQVPTP